jgi:23S rRNA pseudouridine1911/1915/1917 synthase
MEDDDDEERTPHGREAITHFRTEQVLGPVSLLRVTIETGRTHQIRVHLAERGWPLVGDPTYGEPPRRRLASTALDRHARSFGRQALHAWRLQIRLPSSGERLLLEAPLPDDLAALARRAGFTHLLAGPTDRSRTVP